MQRRLLTIAHRSAFVIPLLLLLSAGGSLRAERPTASSLLPENTLAYLRLADMPETRKRFKETSLGRIAQDPKMSPLLESLYGAVIVEFQRVEERIGASLDELLSLPQGELCIAVVSPEEGPPAVVLLVEARERAPILNTVLESIDQRILERGGQLTEESNREMSLVMIELPGDRQRKWVHCERDETILISNNLEVVQDMLAAWDGKAENRLAEDADFKTIVRRCAGPHEATPDAILFVDPIALFRRLSQGNLGAQTALAMLPALGLDGVRGVGAAVLFAEDEYDSIAHLHLLLDSPRRGVLEMLAMESGDTTPEPWVPEDVARYMTVHWNVPQTYTAFTKLFDTIRGEGELAAIVDQRLSQPLGVDFEKEILDSMDGRISFLSWMVKPARMNSQARMLAVKLKDVDQFQKTFSRFLARVGGGFREDSFAGTTFYHLSGSGGGSAGRERPLMRDPDPSIALLDDYLLVTDSSELLKHVIATKKRNSQSLAEQLEYRLVASKISGHPGGKKPGMIIFDRPEEAMRLMYELATSDPLREGLRGQAENNRFMGSVNQALNDHPLPPFAAIAKYLAPGGSLIVSDASGLHMTSFTLRRK